MESNPTYPTYDPTAASQLRQSVRPDLLPAVAEARDAYLENVAFAATIYGLPAAYQYVQLVENSALEGDSLLVNHFFHGPGLADPAYASFRVPNVDTIYSNVWFDLSDGPVRVTFPDLGDRYYTLNLFDSLSNASNLSSRTLGRGPARVVLAAEGQKVTVADGERVHVAPGHLVWGLMRIQVLPGDTSEQLQVLQRSVALDPGPRELRGWPHSTHDEVEVDADAFFRILEFVLAHSGVPVAEVGHVLTFRALGVSPEGYVPPADDAAAAAVQRGFDRAMDVVRQSRNQLGEQLESGWTRVGDKGVHGYNFLARCVMSQVGLGANVSDENLSFNTFVDVHGDRLDGWAASYLLDLADPPPVDHFWSVTVYDAETGRLCPNEAGVHSVSNTSFEPGPGGGTVLLASTPDPDHRGPWLPVPASGFFLVFRCYGPGPALLAGEWTPPGLMKAARS